MAHKGPKNPEKSFGISVGIVLLLVTAFLIWRGRIMPAQIVGPIGAVLLLLGLTRPSLLKYPSAAWWKLAMVLGFINARIILSILFFFILTPLSIIWRLIGKDPLTRRRSSWHGWSPYPERYRDRNHLTRMY
jgi:hypothetical protein